MTLLLKRRCPAWWDAEGMRRAAREWPVAAGHLPDVAAAASDLFFLLFLFFFELV